MNIYEVKLFILGLPILSGTTRTEYIEAETQDEAEQLAHDWYVSDGWGVYDSRLYVEPREGLSDTQKKEARKYASELLLNVIPDWHDNEAVLQEIEEDIYEDIETCAEWQEMNEDEWCMGDVEIALARVLKARICRE